MGNYTSQPGRSVVCNSDAFNQQGNPIFESAPDEQAYHIEFHSKLFNKEETSIVKNIYLPKESVIVDIMFDPKMFTQLNKPIDVFTEVLVPLFNGTDENKPQLHQILATFFKFLHERPMPFLIIATKNRRTYKELMIEHSQKAQYVHTRNAMLPKNFSHQVLESLNSPKEILPQIPAFSSHFAPNTSYSMITQRMLGLFTECINSAYCAIRWGFFSSDLTPVIAGLTAFKRILATNPKALLKMNFPGFAENIPRISLTNSIFLPSNELRFGSAPINQYKIKNMPKSMMVCNGRHLYLLNADGVLTIISLSKSVPNNGERYSVLDLGLNNTTGLFLASSNGQLLIMGSKVPLRVYEMESLKRYTKEIYNSSYGFFKTQLATPLACDGKYIFSLTKPKKISVFIVELPNLKMVNTIYLVEGNCGMKTPFEDELVPKQWMNDAIVSTNGVVFSFFVLIGSNEGTYNYFTRHFSLITGQHIGDTPISLQYPISQICFDPWNRCHWVASPSKDSLNLVKFPVFASMPSWMSGFKIEKQIDIQQIADSFVDTKSAQIISSLLMNFFTYYTQYFIGVSFYSSIYNPLYDAGVAQFFSPCTQAAIDVIMDCIHFFLEQSIEPKDFIITLFGLLQINLSNCLIRTQECPQTDSVLDLFETILKREKMKYLHRIIGFTIISSFNTLFNQKISRAPSFFHLLLSTMSGDFQFYMIQVLSSINMLPYCFSTVIIQDLVDHIFDKMIIKSPDLTSNEIDIVTTLQRDLLKETYQMFHKFEFLDLSPDIQMLTQNFITYSTHICASMSQCIAKRITDSKTNDFVRLFRHYLILLHPLSNFFRIAPPLVECLHGVYNTLQLRHFKSYFDEHGFSNEIQIFFEVLSVFIDFLSAMIDGGEELRKGSQLTWLAKSVYESHLTYQKFINMVSIFSTNKTKIESKVKLVKKGIRSENSSEIARFIADAIQPQTTEPVLKLFEYFYLKVNNIIVKKRNTDEDKYIDRLVFMALVKQLGFTSEIMILQKRIMQGEKPELSHFVKISMDCVYKVRRELKKSKQITIQNEETSTKLFENYPKLVEQIIQKSILLIHISPCFSAKRMNVPDMVSHILKFLFTDISVNDCFQIISITEASRKHIADGFEIINRILQSDIDMKLAILFIDRIAQSKSIIKCISLMTPNEQKAQGQVMTLLSIISKMISIYSSNSLIVFYVSLLLELGKNDIQSIFTPIEDLIRQLENNIHKNSYIALIVAGLYALHKEQKTCDFQSLRQMLFPSDELNGSRLIIARLCFAINMELPYTSDMIIDFLITASPDLYHSGFGYLYQLLQKSENPYPTYLWILKEISEICCGRKSSFQQPADILLGLCSDLIQLCRKCLTTPNSPLIDIFIFIIKYHVDNSTEGREEFKNPMLLFSVFAVLSNAIDSFRIFSMLKDESTNTTYYVTEISDSFYHGWKLPINGESIYSKLSKDTGLLPESTQPFDHKQFPYFDLLLPYFKRSLIQSHTSNIEEARDFYILSSLLRYIKDTTYLKQLIEECNIQINELTFSESNADFIALLKTHLRTDSHGYALRQQASQQLKQCSPATDFSECLIESNQITCFDDTCVFISGVLSTKQPTFFEIEGTGDFNAGVHCFALIPQNSNTCVYCNRKQSIIYNSTRVVTYYKKLKSFTICFNPIKCQATIYDSNKHKYVANFPTNKVCFFLHLFRGSKVKYFISYAPRNSAPINALIAQYLCPVSGQAVFRRREMKPSSKPQIHEPAHETQSLKFKSPFAVEKDGKEVYFKQPIYLTDEFRTAIAKPAYNMHPPTELDMLFALEFIALDAPNGIRFAQDMAYTPFITYPAQILKQIGTQLITKKSDEQIPPPVLAQFCLNRLSNTALITAQPVFYQAEDKQRYAKKPLHQKCDPINMLYPLHPNYYPNLPTETINFFATGTVSQIRKELLTRIAVTAFSKSTPFTLPPAHIIELGVQILLKLEPFDIHASCPIDFKYNQLEQVMSMKHHLYRMALQNILTILDTQVVIDEWYKYLLSQFYEIGFHFAKKTHISAVIIPFSTTEKLVKMNSKPLLVFRSGFQKRTSRINGQELSSNILLLDTDVVTVKSSETTNENSVVIIPNQTSAFYRTFFHLAISYKYFIYFFKKAETKQIRIKMYILFIDSFIAQSPFFYNYGSAVLQFLREKIPLTTSDLTEELVQRLSLLSIYSNNHPYISNFLEEQQMMWDERMLLPLKSFFPSFLTEGEKQDIQQLTDITWGIPSAPLPTELSATIDTSKLACQMKMIMKPRISIVGFPFHLVLHVWVDYTIKYPPFTTQIVGDNIIVVTFIEYKPSAYTIVTLSDKSAKDITKEPKAIDILNSNPSKKPRIVIESVVPPKKLKFFIMSHDRIQPQDFIFDHKEYFITNMNELFINWCSTDDQKLLNVFPPAQYSSPTISLENIDAKNLLHSGLNFQINIQMIRTHLLFILNWMLFFDHISFESDPSLKILCESMSMPLRLQRFKKLVEEHSNDEQNNIEFINRKEAVEVRSGESEKLNMTIMAQLTHIYMLKNNDPKKFRKRGDKPWHVAFHGEPVVDAGGPSRELVVEAAQDLVSENCGLFVRVGDGNAMIPVPDQRIPDPLPQYKFAGVLIGICIRSGLVQDFMFADFVWDYLANAALTIEMIYEIDKDYRMMIESLKDVLKSDMTKADFESRYDLNFTIYNSRKQLIPLKNRGRTEKVTLHNLGEFISLCNNFRIAEIRDNLAAMRQGLLENLDFTPPVYVTGKIIEYAACGSKEITYEALKNVIKFNNVTSDQIEMFQRVIKKFSSEERSELLKFTTGRIRLPTQIDPTDSIFKVDHDTTRDKLPKATTCFNQFHLPTYSSFEVAYKMIKTAIEFTGTFENR